MKPNYRVHKVIIAERTSWNHTGKQRLSKHVSIHSRLLFKISRGTLPDNHTLSNIEEDPKTWQTKAIYLMTPVQCTKLYPYIIKNFKTCFKM